MNLCILALDFGPLQIRLFMSFRSTFFCSLVILSFFVPGPHRFRSAFSAVSELEHFGAPYPAEPSMVLIKGGSFQMGDPFAEGFSDELPVHSVILSDYYISKSEVSFEEYDAFCAATGHSTAGDNGWGRGKRPVINIDWYDAIEYCNWLSQKEKRRPVYIVDQKTKDPNNLHKLDTKKWKISADWTADGYRLPTEAEWEYAARERGQKLRYGNGRDSLFASETNFCPLPNKKSTPKQLIYRQKTVGIDDTDANKTGLRHLTGNVWEWCWDWYNADTYQLNAGAKNPVGPEAGAGRALRGGSWYNLASQCRNTYRFAKAPHGKTDNIGFRIVRR
jgi:formylglycine-generating enzyme